MLGEFSIGIGYTQIHHQFKREQYPAFNQIFKIITPIFVTILLGIVFHVLKLNNLNTHLWLSLLLSWLLRFLYILLWQKYELMNLVVFCIQFAFSAMLGIWLYSKIIHNPTLLFPSRDNMVSEIWLLSALFLYKGFEDVKIGNISSENRKRKYIIKTYTEFKEKFEPTIKKYTKDEITENIIYAIMIIENFNRPKVVRLAEWALSPFRDIGTYGLMQIKSPGYLSDIQSVEAGTKAIIALLENVRSASECDRKDWDKSGNYHIGQIINRTAWLYNNSESYANEVGDIYRQISSYRKPTPPSPTTEQLYNAYFSQHTNDE